jgi:hypothetical protein
VIENVMDSQLNLSVMINDDREIFKMIHLLLSPERPQYRGMRVSVARPKNTYLPKPVPVRSSSGSSLVASPDPLPDTFRRSPAGIPAPVTALPFSDGY